MIDDEDEKDRIIDPIEQVPKLRNEISESDQGYRAGVPKLKMSDQEWDKKKALLTKIEEENPLLVDSANSPSQLIGDDRTEGFPKFQHRLPMQSLENTYSENELREFDARLVRLLGERDLRYIVEPKIDGLAVSLTFERGKLVAAATRGNGSEGDDITNNARTIRTLPSRLKVGQYPAPDLIEIRGEIFMTLAEFRRINEEREEEGLDTFANPRNLAAGTIKQLDVREVARRRLEIVLYGAGFCDPPVSGTQAALHERLAAWGLPVVEKQWKSRGIDEVIEAVRELDSLRQSFAYPTDGAVIKLDDIELQRRAAHTAKAPRWAFAYKYAADQAETKILDITIQVGRTGVLTPVAELMPVLLAGTTVARATLHNSDEIARKDIRVTDTVVIEKAGEVIPAVLEVVLSKREPTATPFKFPEFCPACRTRTIRLPNQVAVRCPNLVCPAQVKRSLSYFASKSALDLEGVGGVVAEKLVDQEYVKHPLDLFELSVEKLGALNLGTAEKPRLFGEKNAAKLLSAISRARGLPLARWLLAFAIPRVGVETAHDIAKLHGKIDLIPSSEVLKDYLELDRLNGEVLKSSPTSEQNRSKSKAEKEALRPEYERLKLRADGIGLKLLADGHALLPKRKNAAPREALTAVGPVVAESVLRWFESERGKESLKKLRKLRIAPEVESISAVSPFSGKGVVFTGSLENILRPIAENRVRQLGARVSSAVSKNIDFVVAGPGAGTKLDEAKKLGLKILSEAEFLEMLGPDPKAQALSGEFHLE